MHRELAAIRVNQVTFVWVLLVVGVAGAACRSSLERITPADESAVWSIALAERTEPDRKRVVVPETLSPLSNAADAIHAALQERQSRKVRSEVAGHEVLGRLFDEMIKANQTAKRIPESVVNPKDEILAATRITAQIKQGALVNCSLCDWQKAIDHSGYSEVVWVSRPGYVDRFALVYVESACLGTCGHGFLLLMEKKSGHWSTNDRITVWIS